MQLKTTVLLSCFLSCCLMPLAVGRADVATWTSPGMDVWTYPSPLTPGVRTLGPTFLTSPGLDEFDQFLPSTGRDPGRRGMSFAIFETSTDIPSGLNPLQYEVNSVTVTFTMQESTAGDIHYDDTYDTNAELLDDYVTGDIDTARPMELYGIAQQAGYTGYDFGSGGGGAQPYSETLYPYSPSDATGVLANYPIASDSEGNYIDVSNSLTGGFSATEPDNTTDAFDPVPWSIGTAAGLTPGDVIPDNTTFSFEIDLNIPGVVEYVQSGLTDGALGFYLSSPHFSGDPHNGTTIPYPQWYLKEFNELFGATHPSLEVDYTLLPIPGDFDLDDDVDGIDLAQWQGDYGANGDSDADHDGDSDGADFLVWQRNHTGSPLESSAAIPEPGSLTFVGLGAVLMLVTSRNRKV